jgi:hypothetical protein
VPKQIKTKEAVKLIVKVAVCGGLLVALLTLILGIKVNTHADSTLLSIAWVFNYPAQILFDRVGIHFDSPNQSTSAVIAAYTVVNGILGAVLFAGAAGLWIAVRHIFSHSYED